MNALDRLGLAGNTWVLVMSDHGVLLGERGFIGKSHSQLHRELWDIPFMIRHPQGRLAGGRTDYLALTHDVAPTLLSAVGLPVPRSMQGEDLTVLFEGGQPKRRTYFTSAMKDNVVACDGRWLLIADNQGRKARLYDKRRDPREKRNVASRHPKTVRRLYRKVVADAGGRRPPRFD
jgi:arylsulfatase A-like enzyme